MKDVPRTRLLKSCGQPEGVSGGGDPLWPDSGIAASDSPLPSNLHLQKSSAHPPQQRMWPEPPLHSDMALIGPASRQPHLHSPALIRSLLPQRTDIGCLKTVLWLILPRHTHTQTHTQQLRLLVLHGFAVVLRHVQALVDVAGNGLDFCAQLLLNTFQVESVIVGNQVDGEAEVAKPTFKERRSKRNEISVPPRLQGGLTCRVLITVLWHRHTLLH